VGDAYADLRTTRHRGIGGTARIWNTPVLGEAGAKYVPLDPHDFEDSNHAPFGGWPFGHAHLEPFYRAAHAVCGLGRFAYEAQDWSSERRPGLALAHGCVTRVYQFGTARIFVERILASVRASTSVRLCHHATVCALESTGTRVSSVRFVCPGGPVLRARASLFVLAAGAIETARLLSVSSDANRAAPWTQHSWLGRGFMEHPRDYALTWFPRSSEVFHDAAFYDAHEADDGTIVGGRLALTADAIHDRHLPNASVTLLPRLKPPATPGSVKARVLAQLRSLGKRRSPEGYGWSSVPDPAAVFNAFRMIVNLEQRPRPENRIVLGSGRDAAGVPRIELHWRWRAEEQAQLERLRQTIAASIEGAGLGRVEVRPDLRPDPNAHHHAGTTRMHESREHGVVDAECRVHGCDNLYVTGASVFPTAGFANPTLTIVALALRLAKHLVQRI
jgi:choline dehydrogenase-like flavoprotein